MKRKYPEKLSIDVLHRALASDNKAIAKHFDAVAVIDAFTQVLGASLAGYATNMEFRDGALYVHITSPMLRNDLFMQRSSLIEKINDAIGRKMLFSIVFK